MNLRCIQLHNGALAAAIMWTLVFPIGAVGGGTVVGWGDNRFGECTPGASNVVAIAAGDSQSLLLIDGGTVADFGMFYMGGLDYLAITVPSDLADVVAIAAGSDYSLALKADGTVVAWGPSGELEVPAGLTNVAAITTTRNQNLALRTDGTVVAWGYSTNVPIDLSNVVAITTGILNNTVGLNLALKPDGTALAWDFTGSYTQAPPGWTNLVSISAGIGELLGLKADGTVISWPGGNYTGALGLPNLTKVVAISASSGDDNHISLALLADGTVVGWGFNFNGAGGPFVPPGLSNVVAVAAGGDFDMALVGDAPPVVRASLLSPSWNAGSFSVSLPTQSGRVYRLEYKSSLADANWVALPLVAGNGGVRQLTDPTAIGAQRFYRVRRW